MNHRLEDKDIESNKKRPANKFAAVVFLILGLLTSLGGLITFLGGFYLTYTSKDQNTQFLILLGVASVVCIYATMKFVWILFSLILGFKRIGPEGTFLENE